MADIAQERFVSLVDDARPAPQTEFDRVLHRFLDDLFAAEPVWATGIGFHVFDDRWPDVSDAGRAARLAMLRDHRARFEALDGEALSADEWIDRGIVLEAIEAMEFDEHVLRGNAWDPLAYVSLAGSGFFSLLAREFGPWRHRGAAFLGRLRGLPQLLSAARDELVGLPDRPVSLLHTDTALRQLGGVGELIDEGLAEAERRARPAEAANDDTDAALILESLREAVGPARHALDEFRGALEEEVRRRAEGEGRLGGELFQAKLRHTLGSDLRYEDLLARAERDYAVVRAEMLRLARELWQQWWPDRSLPAADDADSARADDATVRRVLDRISLEHRQPHELIDWCLEEVRRVEDFCRQRNVIGLPDEPLKITWTPVFMRAYGRAFLDSPGPLDKGLASHFWITPPDETAGPEAVESYLREDNDRMLSLMCIHEGVPGHYLQLAWANRSPALARSVFSSGMFAEGWAVYVTQVMMDLGYRSDDPQMMLTHWKFYLRAITNAIMDVRIHTAGMTEQEAMDLMVNGGFQEEDEARAKWLRARLTSTQLSTYYLGSLEMWDLEVEARRRAAVEAGAGPDAVPAQQVVGGLGETPGFDYRRHLEAVISHGTPPIKWVRRILVGETDHN
ncbi:MAG TPA: DUF885 domain-containing protein [Candidatus Caenarcaniphilales bacterium]|nr:DUF885 domain-containing protein [Candidatus Caenarcaniphilales bacterium]